MSNLAAAVYFKETLDQAKALEAIENEAFRLVIEEFEAVCREKPEAVIAAFKDTTLEYRTGLEQEHIPKYRDMLEKYLAETEGMIENAELDDPGIRACAEFVLRDLAKYLPGAKNYSEIHPREKRRSMTKDELEKLCNDDDAIKARIESVAADHKATTSQYKEYAKGLIDHAKRLLADEQELQAAFDEWRKEKNIEARVRKYIIDPIINDVPVPTINYLFMDLELMTYRIQQTSPEAQNAKNWFGLYKTNPGFKQAFDANYEAFIDSMAKHARGLQNIVLGKRLPKPAIESKEEQILWQIWPVIEYSQYTLQRLAEIGLRMNDVIKNIRLTRKAIHKEMRSGMNQI